MVVITITRFLQHPLMAPNGNVFTVTADEGLFCQHDTLQEAETTAARWRADIERRAYVGTPVTAIIRHVNCGSS